MYSAKQFYSEVLDVAGRVSKMRKTLPGRCNCATAGMKQWMMQWCARSTLGLLPTPATLLLLPTVVLFP